jgi:predicted  nucleic acid-binding Zn-ribbon protein
MLTMQNHEDETMSNLKGRLEAAERRISAVEAEKQRLAQAVSVSRRQWVTHEREMKDLRAQLDAAATRAAGIVRICEITRTAMVAADRSE